MSRRRRAHGEVMTKKPIVFSRHAKRRMKWRGISKEEVVSAIRHSDELETSEGEKRESASFRTKKGIIKVVFVDETDRILVVTAMRKRT